MSGLSAASPRVFVSYSHRDGRMLGRLLPYLTTLEQERLVSVWTDQAIRGGERWREEIEAALDAARVAVLLISQEFLTSTFIRVEELPRILKRQTENRLTVLPVFVSPSTVTSEAIILTDDDGNQRRIVLSDFQGFGTPEQTLSELDVPDRQRRFLALHERIREICEKASRETDASDSRGTLDGKGSEGLRPRISRIPLPRNRTFTGREQYLQRLHNDLRSGKAAVVTQALAGLGGIGKTQLALEYTYRYATEYDIVWWIRAEQHETRQEDFRRLGYALGVARDLDVARLVDVTLGFLERHGDWLLVFDNAEHPDEIRDLIPKSGGGGIIITSRYQAWRAVAQTVTLGLWTPEEAADYLARRTAFVPDPAAAAVAHALGFLPLGLAQAAAYIEETGCGYASYLKLLEARPAETLKLRANSSHAETVVATVWDIAFERVAASNPAAVELLNLFAFLPPDRILRSLLVEHSERLPSTIRSAIEEPLAFDAAIAALRRYSFLESGGDAFSVHRLVQAVVRARLDNNDYRLLSEAAKELVEPVSSSTERISTAAESADSAKRWNAPRSLILALVISGTIVVTVVVTPARRWVWDPFFVHSSERPPAVSNTPAPRPRASTSQPIPAVKDSTAVNFDGIAAGRNVPPDTSGAAGPFHYIQTADDAFAVFDKAGHELVPPTSITSLWKGRGGLCETGERSSGPAVLYDHLADRWLLALTVYKSSQPELPEYECIAVSRSADPVTRGWNLYDYQLTSEGELLDYAKFGVWTDGYYMTSPVFRKGQLVGSEVCVFERSAMLRGRPAKEAHVRSRTSLLLPANLNGSLPAPGPGGLLLGIASDATHLAGC